MPPGRPTSRIDQPGAFPLDRLEAPLAASRLQHPEALLAQVQLDQVGDVRVVLDDDDRAQVVFHGLKAGIKS